MLFPLSSYWISSLMSVDSNAVLYSGLACILIETLPVSFRLNTSLSLSFRGGLQQTSWTRVFLEPTDHFDVESATYKEHRVSQLSSQFTWREQLLDANVDQGLGAVFATLKIPTLFRKTTSVLVHSLLFLSETLRPCLEQAHVELYVLLRTEGQKKCNLSSSHPCTHCTRPDKEVFPTLHPSLNLFTWSHPTIERIKK